MEEWWWGEFVKKNTGLDWGYLDDMWAISSRYHPHIIQLSKYHPHIIHMICGWYHPDIIHILYILSKIIHILPTYRPNITQSIFLTTFQLDEKSTFNPDMARLLQKKTPLWNSIKTPLFIIQILPKYHPNIIQKSPRNHPEIIQKSSKNHPVDIDFYNPPTWWKVEFSSRYGTTIAGENSTFKLDQNSTSGRHRSSFTRF